MSIETMPTHFAPAERSSRERLVEEANLILRFDLLKKILDMVPDFCLILNQHRQIISANRAFTTTLRVSDIEHILGLRPGEAVGCMHSDLEAGGCGTSTFCRVCGAVKAIVNCQQGKPDSQECRIVTRTGDALDLRVWASPFLLEEHLYTFFVIQDISHEKRRRMLERIFFHDILNTAGGLYGYADLLTESCPHDGETAVLSKHIFTITDSIIQEIQSQKDLVAAEGFELTLKPERLSSLEILKEVAASMQNHIVAKGKSIVASPGSAPVSFTSDRTLVKRVLGNMTKNALEASVPGNTVTLSSIEDGGGVRFAVHNLQSMPPDVQLQIFKRSYSTKGAGRGLGTYSIKLLTERYLKGHAGFTSSLEQGTTFFASYPLTMDLESEE